MNGKIFLEKVKRIMKEKNPTDKQILEFINNLQQHTIQNLMVRLK